LRVFRSPERGDTPLATRRKPVDTGLARVTEAAGWAAPVPGRRRPDQTGPRPQAQTLGIRLQIGRWERIPAGNEKWIPGGGGDPISHKGETDPQQPTDKTLGATGGLEQSVRRGEVSTYWQPYRICLPRLRVQRRRRRARTTPDAPVQPGALTDRQISRSLLIPWRAHPPLGTQVVTSPDFSRCSSFFARAFAALSLNRANVIL
jgi:hypothetical protein